ncbi:MAG: MFS transporter [Vicinamibacteria bacterium]|nr:MFS transporter [Vicinamibacteria bacterium]
MTPLSMPATETLPLGLARRPLYYGWVNLGVAAAAMVGTLPGRTQGLGLVTEPLMKDLGLDRVAFAEINLWATLAGSLFCLGIGRLIDRAGSRAVLTALALGLGAVVLAMSAVTGAVALLLLVTLTRGFGQSALSVASLALVGKWFSRRLPVAMGVYSVVMSVGFMLAFPLVGAIVLAQGWRAAWATIGFALVAGLAPLALAFARNTPESCGVAVDGAEAGDARDEGPAGGHGATLGEALRTGAFWVFALSSAIYGLIASGIALFNESILAERGFDPATYHRSLAVTAIVALAGNFGGGWALRRISQRTLLVTAMALLGLGLLALPQISTQAGVMAWAAAMGLAGGFVIVGFFSAWGQFYGRAHLGRIQGAAQILTVLASAIGPLLLARAVEWTGSYATAFHVLAAVVFALAASALAVRVPAAAAR